MKILIIIASFFAGALAKVVAQEKNPITLSSVIENREINSKEFVINTNEDLVINLNVMCPKNQNLSVFILDRQNRIIERKEILSEGENKINFEMEQEDLYKVKITSLNPISLDLSIVEN